MLLYFYILDFVYKYNMAQ